MRKKSHISLARYMVENLKDEELKHHKFSFYLGSILPDIKPSFLYKRHEMDGTFPYVSRHIRRLSEGDALIRKKKGCKYYRDLGQISHYLADYFTFPHNTIYPGSLKDHCSYEEKLKRDLRSYLKSGELPDITGCCSLRKNMRSCRIRKRQSRSSTRRRSVLLSRSRMTSIWRTSMAWRMM